MITLKSFKEEGPFYWWGGIAAFFFRGPYLIPQTANLPQLPQEVRRFILSYDHYESEKFVTYDGEVEVPGWVLFSISTFADRMNFMRCLPCTTDVVLNFLSIFERFVEGEEMSEKDFVLLDLFHAGLSGKNRREIYMDRFTAMGTRCIIVWDPNTVVRDSRNLVLLDEIVK